jgi:ElaB/YqjD/DUF883 family membrane-anchored ribosome-binding protein
MTKEISFCLKVDEAPSLPGAYAMAIDLEAPMTKNTEGAAGDLAADLAALRQDVARLGETVSELVHHQVADAQENVRAVRGEIEASIERNPMTAVPIAFGIGMLIGRMNRSRG